MKKRTVTSRLEIDFSAWLSTLPDPHFYKGTSALNVSEGTDKLQLQIHRKGSTVIVALEIKIPKNFTWQSIVFSLQ